jgi:hypothetical protein
MPTVNWWPNRFTRTPAAIEGRLGPSVPAGDATRSEAGAARAADQFSVMPEAISIFTPSLPTFTGAL